MDDTAPNPAFTAFALHPLSPVTVGDNLAELLHPAAGDVLVDGDVVVVASKVGSIAEKRHVDLAGIAVSEAAPPTPTAAPTSAARPCCPSAPPVSHHCG